MPYSLFDTHTHFDVPDFDHDREQLYLCKNGGGRGGQELILIGFVHSRFNDLLKTQHFLNQLPDAPQSYLAPGLHPFYIEQHQASHLADLERILTTESCGDW